MRGFGRLLKNRSVDALTTILSLSVFLAGSGLIGCTASTTERLGLPPLKTVSGVDLSRYVGRWYEIASFPQRFQRGCTGSTATYSLRKDGDIKVVNRCRDGSLKGKLRSVTGKAWVVERKTNAKLKVSFFWPFRGDYWIIDLDKKYKFAVVGHPGRDYLWILSRTPTMKKSTYEGILRRLKAKGYQLGRLKKTLQPGSSESKSESR